MKMLQPRIKMIKPRIKMLRAPRKTLKQRQLETGRTLALNGAAWRKLRAQVLAEHPLCTLCQRQGLVVEATDVDHVNNDPRDNRRENLQPLCHECHSRKTQQDAGKTVNWGCDVAGMPLDPAHPWNREITNEAATGTARQPLI